jgi:hypothetical protein
VGVSTNRKRKRRDPRPLSELDRLAAEEDALRARRALITYRLEQTVREKDRLQRHLKALTREEEGAA